MRPSRGSALVEVTLAALLFSIITTLLMQTVMALRTTLISRDSRLECARATRDVLLRLSLDLRQAAWVPAGPLGPLDGHVYAANELVFAVPDSATTYKLVGLYPSALNPPDPRNPTAQELVYYVRGLQTPAQPGKPETLDLAGVTLGQRRSYRCYLTAGSLSWSVGAGSALSVIFWTARIPERGTSLLERRALTCWPRLSR